jgi:chromosome partitioning protein
MTAIAITIATHKGGTGKTVTAMALGAGLTRSGKSCLIIDLDPQGHSTLGLGVAIEDGAFTVREFFAEPSIPLPRILRETHIPGLYVAPSNIRLARFEPSLYMRPKREELLRRGLRAIRDQFDVIIMDCPPSLGVLTEEAITAADLIIIPCQMEARASDGLVDLLELVSIMKGETFEQWRILITRVDSRKSTTNQAVMASLARWQQKIFHTRIPQSEPLNQAQIARTDIFSFEPHSKGALAYEAFAKEVLRYVR